MTLGDYLSNPYGRGVGLSPTAMIRQTTEEQLRHDYPEPISYTMYRVQSYLVIHCKMPSRTKKGIAYDVIFQLDCSEMLAQKSRAGIQHCPFRCFSNAPSFLYTYAKAFRERGLLCDWLRSKYDEPVLRKQPDTRNPNHLVGYERTLYSCAWTVFENSRSYSAVELLERASRSNFTSIAAQVQSQSSLKTAYANASDTDAVYQRKQEALQRKQAREAERQAKREANPQRRQSDSPDSPHTKNVKGTANSPATSRSKRSAHSKKL